MKTFSLTQDQTFNNAKVTAEVIMETPFSKEIRLLFRKGQIMKKHKTSFPITIEVFQGAIDLSVEGESKVMLSGDMIYLDADVPHSLKAKANSIVRLTLSKFDKIERIEELTNGT